MPTYTYTTSANMPIGSHSTGITLAPNEYICQIHIITHENIGSASWKINRNFTSGFSLNLSLADSQKTDECNIYFTQWSSSQSSGAVFGWAIGREATDGLTKTYSSGTRLKGKTLYCTFYDTDLNTGDDLVASDATFMSALDITITTDISTSVTTQVNPSGAGTISNISGEYLPGESINVTVTPATGYLFKNWGATGGSFTSTSDASTTFTVPNDMGSVTVIAYFSVSPKKSVTTQAYPSGTGTVTNISDEYYIGASISLSATPATGYVFDRWVSNRGEFANANSSTTTFTVPDEDVIVYGCFKESGSVSNAGRYNGTDFEKVIPMYYNGTDWEECEWKYYDGTNWVDADTL